MITIPMIDDDDDDDVTISPNIIRIGLTDYINTEHDR